MADWKTGDPTWAGGKGKGLIGAVNYIASEGLNAMSFLTMNGLWGTIMAGGAGNEWYFGYSHDHSDLTCQDFRSRDKWWDYCRHALNFFANNNVPFWNMANDNSLSTASNDYCLADKGNQYVVYLKNGGTTSLDLNGASGTFTVRWYNPRSGGSLQTGSVASVTGGGTRSLGNPPSDSSSDWTLLVRK